MQEKRNIRLLISLVILLVLTTVVFLYNNSDGSQKIDKDIFRNVDLKTIDQVSFSTRNKIVELKYNGSQWLVNNKYKADRNLVDVLFATLHQAEPKRPVALSLKDSLNNTLKQSGVKVSLFSEGKMIKTFYAGGNALKTQAYFLREGDDTPYIMVIPGYRVYASGILELDVNGWRDKRIFDFNWRNFKSLSATFPGDAKQNFKVSFVDKYFSIENLQTDTTKLNNYLDAISYLTAHQFIDRSFSSRYDSLAQTPPVVKIEIKDVADRVFPLEVFFPLKNDPNVLGQVSEGEFILLQQQTIAPLVRGRNYFEQKN